MQGGANPTEGGRQSLCRSNDVGTACSPAEARYYRTARREPSAGIDPPHTSPRPAGCRAARTSATAAGASASADDGASAAYAPPHSGPPHSGLQRSGPPHSGLHHRSGLPLAQPLHAATARGYSLLVKQAFWSNFPVENVEGRQADVGEFLVVQRKDGKGCGILRRHIRGRRRRRCAAGDRQQCRLPPRTVTLSGDVFPSKPACRAPWGSSLCRRTGTRATDQNHSILPTLCPGRAARLMPRDLKFPCGGADTIISPVRTMCSQIAAAACGAHHDRPRVCLSDHLRLGWFQFHGKSAIRHWRRYRTALRTDALHGPSTMRLSSLRAPWIVELLYPLAPVTADRTRRRRPS